MTSLSVGEQKESLFYLNGQPYINLQRSESFDGIKSIEPILSASSSITSTTLPHQHRQQPYPSQSSQDLTPQLRYPNPNDTDSFARQYERRLDEYRLYWQKEYDR